MLAISHLDPSNERLWRPRATIITTVCGRRRLFVNFCVNARIAHLKVSDPAVVVCLISAAKATLAELGLPEQA